eukprot:IDg20381t1
MFTKGRVDGRRMTTIAVVEWRGHARDQRDH